MAVLFSAIFRINHPPPPSPPPESDEEQSELELSVEQKLLLVRWLSSLDELS